MKKLIIIFISVLAAMLLAGEIFDSSYKKFWRPLFDKLGTTIKDSTYHDGIYLGDSRAHFGINPYYIDSTTGYNTYNVGMGGATINEINFLAKQYIAKHRPPKFAVISVGYSDILSEGKFFENPCHYFFYADDSSTDNTLQRLGYHTTLFKILPFLKYTAFDDYNKLSIIKNMQGKTFLQEGGIAYKGFINNSANSFNIQALEKFAPEDKPFGKSLSVLEETIKLFLDKNTLPILVYPPATHHIEKPKAPVEIKIDSAIALLARRHKVPLLYFDNDGSFTNDCFMDQWHLNLKGTVLYSQKLGAEIKRLLPDGEK